MAKRQLSKAQRDFILERDNGQCQFYTYYKGRGLVRCPNKTDLHVHHIKPHRWLARKFTSVIELPENLVTLCKQHHFGHIHPDMQQALREYYRDRKSIEKVFEKRNEQVLQNIPYWVQRYDDLLAHIAREATRAFKKSWPK